MHNYNEFMIVSNDFCPEHHFLQSCLRVYSIMKKLILSFLEAFPNFIFYSLPSVSEVSYYLGGGPK